MTPDVSGVRSTAQAMAEDFGRYTLDVWAYKQGLTPNEPNPDSAKAKIGALQQAAEQACYRYLRDFLDKLMDYPATTIREQYEGLIREECLRLDKLIAGRA